MAKKADVIETEIFSQLLGGNRVLKVEPEDPGPINLEEETTKRDSKKEPTGIKHDFKQGDLVVPDTGIANAFYFQRNMKLSGKYTYHLANSAERTYFHKRVQDSKTSVSSYTEIQDMAYEKHDYDKDDEKSPATRIH